MTGHSFKDRGIAPPEPQRGHERQERENNHSRDKARAPGNRPFRSRALRRIARDGHGTPPLLSHNLPWGCRRHKVMDFSREGRGGKNFRVPSQQPNSSSFAVPYPLLSFTPLVRG